MADARDTTDQVEHAALQQIVVLNMATQSLRPRLDAEGVTLEESVVLGQMLAGLSNLMLEWVKVLVFHGNAEEFLEAGSAADETGENCEQT